MKVKCIETYFDNEMQRNIDKGEVFEVSAARYDVLAGNNDYKTVFVEKVKEKIEVEDAKAEPVVEKAVKKTTRKKKAE